MALNLNSLFLVTLVAVIGCVFCQQNEIETGLKDLQKNFENIIPELNNKNLENLIPELNSTDLENISLLKNFDQSQMPNADQALDVIKKKCDSRGGEGTFQRLADKAPLLQECYANLINVTQVQIEVEEAKKTGSMDEVFGKYCARYPEMLKCNEDFYSALIPCLDVQEQENLNLSVKLVNKLQEFACFKDGDRIAMFVAEGGVPCLQSQLDGLGLCMKESVGSDVANAKTESFVDVLFKSRKCSEFDDLRKCVGITLEKCTDTTPANLVDALFKFLKKLLPCKNGLIQGTELREPLKSGARSMDLLLSCLYVILPMTLFRLF